MNIEGMPWHVKTVARDEIVRDDGAAPREFPLDRRETRSFIWGALGAALLIAAVFLGGMAAFILFCTQVWLR